MTSNLVETTTALTTAAASLAMGFFLIGTFFGALFWKGLKIVRRKGKARLIIIDEDTGMGKAVLGQLKADGVLVKKGPYAGTYLVDPKARIANVPPTWIVTRKYGWTLRAPSSAETVEKGGPALVMSVSNPKSYHVQIARNKAGQALSANDDTPRPSWIPLAITLAFIGFLIIVGGLGYIIFSLGDAAASPPPAPLAPGSAVGAALTIPAFIQRRVDRLKVRRWSTWDVGFALMLGMMFATFLPYAIAAGAILAGPGLIGRILGTLLTTAAIVAVGIKLRATPRPPPQIAPEQASIDSVWRRTKE